MSKFWYLLCTHQSVHAVLAMIGDSPRKRHGPSILPQSDRRSIIGSHDDLIEVNVRESTKNDHCASAHHIK
jgi:hypothetical protein